MKPTLPLNDLTKLASMEKQIGSPNTPLPSSPLPMHKNSHTISKTKPEIRIIHIFAPEIIKTDAANFRELVQRLTGKPSDEDLKTKKKSRKKIAMIGEFRERIKGEEEIWRGANSGGGFLGEFDGFMQQLNYDDHFPFHVEEASTQTQDALFGDTHQIA